jgi:hypothetical protein
MNVAATTLKKITFKYSKELEATTDFSPATLVQKDQPGFRLVKSNLDDESNFLPQAILVPNRHVHGRSIAASATGFALSMFESLDLLKTRTRSILKNSPQFLKRVGNHYAQLDLTSEDGASTATNGTGHFDFFEDVTFVPKSAVVSHSELEL